MGYGVRVAAADTVPADEGRASAAQIGWRRLLCFPDRQLEAEFMVDWRKARRKGTLLLMNASSALMIFEFLLSDGFTKIGMEFVVLKALYLSRLVGLLLVVVWLAVTWSGVMDPEVGSVLHCATVAVSLFTGDTFRASQVGGVDPFEVYGGGCESAVSGETLLTLALAGCTAVTITFAAIRVSRSWTLVVLTVVLYVASGLLHLGPLSEDDVFIVAFLYVVLVSLLWSRCYSQERDFRQQWLDNRRLRMEVQTQRRLYEEQQNWLEEVNERLAALQSGDDLVPIARPSERRPDAPTIDIVPDLRVFRAPLPQRGPCPTAPNAVLVRHTAGRQADQALVRKMAARLRDPGYGLREYFDDCAAAFPELELFYVCHGATSSGRTGHVEYQRTLGALFSVYWFLRLDTDGREGLSFGYDDEWSVRSSPAGMDPEKKQSFFRQMDWASLRDVTELALGGCVERIEAMLCLTAFHDIMKVSMLLPHVSAEHAPYHDHQAGDSIFDHDLALAYVLENYPHLIPSFMVLPEKLRNVVLFTQTKMSFNHGWFVQAEGTPGAMLSPLKQVLRMASGADLAFYFVHWLSDIAGAEGTPLAGAEKFTRKFPHGVLRSFLWSMSYLQRLTEQSETEVVEGYLEARFKAALPGRPLPEGDGAVATLRLAVMAQQFAALAVDAFEDAPSAVQCVLSVEMALTGIRGQSFGRSPASGGPAFLVYYGPALLQRCATRAEMRKVLTALASVYDSGRRLWPRRQDRGHETVTIEVAQLRAMSIDAAVDGSGAKIPRVWVLARENDREAKLALLSALEVNRMLWEGTAFVCVDLGFGGDPAPCDAELESNCVK